MVLCFEKVVCLALVVWADVIDLDGSPCVEDEG